MKKQRQKKSEASRSGNESFLTYFQYDGHAIPNKSSTASIFKSPIYNNFEVLYCNYSSFCIFKCLEKLIQHK